MLSRESRKYIQPIAVSVVVSIAFIFCVNFAYQNILQSHQRNRIDVILGKLDDPRGQGYNLNQSKIAIGSGGLWGKGYLQGTQTKYDFVPEQSTDFIFCTVGEEWGFAGSLVVIALYLTMLLRIVNIAERQRSSFSRIYGYGVASILFFHFFINIGMTIGLVPVIGIPLPFLSYGGSSLWSFTILLFILLKLDSNRMGVI
jgi:rod shape determining protein RodA